MTATGTHWRPSAPVCVALAAAAHAAVLLVMMRPAHDAARGPAVASGAITARYVADAPPVRGAATPEPPAETTPAQTPEAHEPGPAAAAAAHPAPDEAGAADATTAPTFAADAAPVLEHPDAPLPADGVRVRVFVQLGPGGAPADVVVSPAPGDSAPAPAFEKAAARALRQAQFSAGSGPNYCFLVRFDPGTPQPQLAWLPGAARDAARCLTGRQPAPREMAPATAP